MNELMEILKEIRPDVDFENASELMSGGIMDSLDIVVLVGELADKFGVEITVEHLLPENFDSPVAIMSMIKSLSER